MRPAEGDEYGPGKAGDAPRRPRSPSGSPQGCAAGEELALAGEGQGSQAVAAEGVRVPAPQPELGDPGIEGGCLRQPAIGIFQLGSGLQGVAVAHQRAVEADGPAGLEKSDPLL